LGSSPLLPSGSGGRWNTEAAGGKSGYTMRVLPSAAPWARRWPSLKGGPECAQRAAAVRQEEGSRAPEAAGLKRRRVRGAHISIPESAFRRDSIFRLRAVFRSDTGGPVRRSDRRRKMPGREPLNLVTTAAASGHDRF